MKKWVLLISGIFTLLPVSVRSHPHVFIRNRVNFVMDNGKVTAIQHEWQFDPFFTTELFNLFDANKDHRLDKNEQKKLEHEGFASVSEFDYFTYLTVDGQPVPLIEYRDFTASMVTLSDAQVDAAGADKKQVGSSFRTENTGATQHIVYRFTMPIANHPTPASQKLSLAVYDKSYYIDVQPQDQHPIGFVDAGGNPIDKCQAQIVPYDAARYYYGLVVPKKIEITCNQG